MLNKNYYIFMFNNLKISTIWPRLSTCPLFHGNILVTICAQVWFPIYVRGSLQWIMCPRDSWGLIALLASTADPRLSKHFFPSCTDSSPLTCSVWRSRLQQQPKYCPDCCVLRVFFFIFNLYQVTHFLFHTDWVLLSRWCFEKSWSTMKQI